MLEKLGVSSEAETIYWAMLEHPTWGVEELAEGLGIGESDVREALSALADHALVQSSWTRPGVLRAVSPQVGLIALLERVEQEMRAQQQRFQTTRAMVLAVAAGHDNSRRRDEIVRLEGLDAVRDRLAELAHVAATECMSFTTGAAMSVPAIEAGKTLNQRALGRGVAIRNIYQDSMLADEHMLGYARWMAERGALSRSLPHLPMRMTIVDREIALVPLDPCDSSLGALEVRGRSLLVALCLLFDQTWERALPFGESSEVDDRGLSSQEIAILRYLRQGQTDEAIGRRLGLSERTVRRTVSDLMKRLNAGSRFQAGAAAAARGWV